MEWENDIAGILFSESEIAAMRDRLAAQINSDYAGKQPVFVSILKGSFVFMADIIRKITLPCSLDFMCVSSYGMGSESGGHVKIIKGLDINPRDKDIILIEDILDSGLTLSYIKGVISLAEPRSLKICTLLDKPERRRADIQADYVGAVVPDEFIVGYGLDYAESYRSLPYIAVLKEEVYTK